ncbi:MAG: hypothetical protein LBH41_00490, partial [Rickettsiales bacterium]|nr:hypothetical protein [Rickettsiales bacterium]
MAGDVRHNFYGGFRFLAAILSSTLVSLLIGGAGFFIVSIIAVKSSSGEWGLDSTFDSWIQDMGAVPLADGRYSVFDPQVCKACPILSSLFDMVNIVAMNVYVMIADLVWILLTASFALWLLRQTYDDITKNSGGDLKAYGEKVFKKILTLFVIGGAIGFMDEAKLRSVATEIVEFTVVPVVQAGVGIGSHIALSHDKASAANAASGAGAAGGNPAAANAAPGTEAASSPGAGAAAPDGADGAPGDAGQALLSFCDRLSFDDAAAKERDKDGNLQDVIISSDLKKDLLCLAATINNVFYGGISAGWNMASFSWKNEGVRGILDVVGGLAIVVIFFTLYIWVPLMILDMIFTLGLLVAFIPLMIAGYGYEDTRGFSSQGVAAVFGIAWRMIVYMVFLAVLVQSFMAIGDAYYPAPVDGFTYLFPDFLMHGSSKYPNASAIAARWRECYAMGGTKDALAACMARIGVDFDMPSLENAAASFMPVFSLGIVSLMLMGMRQTYADILGGYMFQIGDTVKGFLIGSFKYVWSGAREYAGALKRSPIEAG